MKSIETLLRQLTQLEIHLWVEDGRLRYNAPKGKLTSELKEELVKCKDDLVRFLEQVNPLPVTGEIPIPLTSRQEPLPLSFSQQRLWFLNQLEQGQATTYNMPPMVVQLSGPLNALALEQSLREILQRHEVLRTSFEVQAGHPVQVVNSQVTLSLSILPLEDRTPAEQREEIQRLTRTQAEQLFDLTQGPLLRVLLAKLGPTEHVFFLTMHHIVSDGWSLGVMVRELSTLYQAFSQGQPSPLPPLPIQYADFAVWQRQRLTGQFLETLTTYWKQQLAGIPALLELPTDYPRRPVQRYRGKVEYLYLSTELTRGLQQLSQQSEVSLFMTLLTAFAILLFRYTGQPDIVIGSPIANRTHSQVEPLIGFFLNTLVLRVNFADTPRFSELLQRVKQVCLDAYAHQDLPFEKLVEELQPARNLSHMPLFQVMLVLQNAPMGEIKLANLTLTPLPTENPHAVLDLSFLAEETPKGLECQFSYNTDLFEQATIKRLAGHFQTLVEGILAQPDQAVQTLPLLTSAELAQLMAWNQTQVDYPKDQTIVDLFQAQVAKTPENLAVVFETQTLTYRELNAKANQLAHYLMTLEVTAETLVGICVERSLEMVIGLLGILKAGGAYVPLDPAYPAERLQFMLEDSQVPVLLTQGHLLSRVPESKATVVLLDQKWEQIASESAENPGRRSGPENLAYVIYTSGSTGRPKGVMIEHRALFNHMQWMQETFVFSSQDRVLQKTPVSFDAAVWEFYAPLLVGGTLVMAKPDGHQDPEYLFTYSQDQQVTVLQVVPSLLNVLLDQTHGRDHLPWRYLFCGGEPLKLEWVQRVGLHFQQTALYNLYGPTEVTIDSTCWCCHPESAAVAIGRPIANLQAYILDSHHQPQPPGVPGELCLAGASLARGYLHRPDLTAEKFPTVELFGKPTRIYKTGDLARWLPDGNLEYLGRLDHQVKLRGFRIELGEIEATLTQHEAVKEAVVVLRETETNPRLAAYVTLSVAKPSGLEDLSGLSTALRTWLATRLPDYMIPASFTVLEKLPLTPNGKIDRHALPAPEFTVAADRYEAPRTELEQQLVNVWQQVLKLPAVGIFENFFEVGGDSILSIQIVARARALGLDLNPRDLFQHQTIAELATVVRPLTTTRATQGLVTGPVPLTPIQQRFLTWSRVEPWYFNQAVLLKVPATLSIPALRQALAKILEHHDALRLRYRQVEGQWQQWHDAPTPAIPVHLEDLTADYLSSQDWQSLLGERATAWQASFNLEEGPLVRLVLFQLGDQARLLWCIHHLVVDGVSWRILVEDLQTVYHQAVAQQPLQLPAKTSAFQDWATHLQAWPTQETFAKEASYWQPLPEPPPWPLDHPAGRRRFVDAQHYTLRFSTTTTQRLLTEAPAAYRTQVMDLLLTALMLTLRNWTGSSHQLLDLESHGRTTQFPDLDLSRTVGWFTSLYTLGLQLPTTAELGDALKAIKEQLRHVPAEGVGYGVLRYGCQTALPQAPILFNYLGQFDQTLGDNDWQWATEEAGQMVSTQGDLSHLIEVNGQTLQGQLSLTWTYSSEQYEAQTIITLADHYQQQLEALLDHCTQAFGYTPSDFPLATLTQSHVDTLAQRYGRHLVNVYPLTPMQQGMLFHTLYAPDQGLYFQQLHLGLVGLLHPELLHRAWQHLVDRHASLRTAFWLDGETPLQVVTQTVSVPWQELDWREFPADQRHLRLQTLLQEERHLGFELSQAPLMRFQLVRETADQWRLVWHFHHLLLDGWSLPMLFTELLRLYHAYTQGQTPTLPPVRPYHHYLQWLSTQDPATARAHWQAQLQGFQAPTPLPHLTRQNESADSDPALYQTVSFVLPAFLNHQLDRVSRRHHLTLNTLVQGAWAVLLSRYSGERDVVFGATTSGRQIPLQGIEQMVGLFINTLPVRMQFTGEDLLTELQGLQHQQQLNQQYAYLSLADLQNGSEVPNGVALFETLLVFENYPVDDVLKQPQAGLQVTDVQTIEYTNYPLTLMVAPGNSLQFRLTYETRRFSPAQMTRVLAHLTRLLEGMVTDLTQPYHQLPLLTDAETQQLLAWNQTQVDYPKDQTVIDLFQAQVAKTPDNIAVVFEDQHLTYQQLNTKANQLAYYLMSLGVQAEALVGICVERSLEMVVGLLGILKAGGAYVPLDPTFPSERLTYYVEDANVAMLLTQTSLVNLFATSSAPKVCLDTPTFIPTLASQSQVNPVSRVTSANLAYVIYTSGSTGKPKGVMIGHQAVVNFLFAMREKPGLTSRDVLLAVTTISFDIAGLELYLPLMVGAKIILASRELAKEGTQLLETLTSSGTTVMQATPATWRLLLASGWETKLPLKVLCGGEALTRELAGQLLSRSEAVWNLYGPTETTIWSAVYSASKSEDLDSSGGDLNSNEGGVEPLGYPIANTQFYILDTAFQLVPVGVAGELHIGGDGLARGYLNRPELTAEKFIRNPFSADPQNRLYKTGDLARYRSDGTLEYLGRIDNQVKIRGFRIELGEIEATLIQHPTIREGVVIVHPDATGDKRLVAYLVTHAGQVVEVTTLREFLKQRLPEYMIPAVFITLEALPLTPNGKVNRRALPAPESTARTSPTHHYVAPRDTLELQLVPIWEDLLKTSPVGIQDNFFELGGHSLLAVRMMAQIEQQFKKRLPLASLFQGATIAQQAQLLRLESEVVEKWSSLVPIQAKGRRPPFFGMAGAGGHVLYFYELARHLEADQPFYGLQPQGLDGESAPHQTVEEIAAYYIETMRTVQPRGPYQIGGHSFGGLVAFEMAQQLHQQGEEVALLAILDTPVPPPSKPHSVQDDWDEAQWLVHLSHIMEHLYHAQLSVREETLRELTPDLQLSYVHEQLKRAQILPPSASINPFRGIVEVYKANVRTHYYPKAVSPVPITLFKAKEAQPEQLTVAEGGYAEALKDPAFGWGNFGQVTVVEVPGDHLTMLTAPHAAALAGRLGEALRKR